MRFACWLFLFGLALPVVADDMPEPVRPVVPGPALPAVELPASPTPQPPVVPPVPAGARVKLAAGVTYDIKCRTECVVRAYPAGLVSVTREAVAAGETLRVKDAFSDGSVSHVYKGPLTIYSVRSVGTGPVEVVITPLGLATENDIVTVGIDADSGQGPIPPPKPKPPEPKPDPKPDPKPPAPVTSFRVFLIYESADTLTAAQRGVLFGKVVEDYLTANCTGGKGGWRRRDKDAPGDGDAVTAALWTAIKPALTTTPCVAVEVNGKVEIVPLESTPAKMVDVLKSYKGK